MKFLYGCFNENTGESIVTIADKYGSYTGQARLHPEDKRYASKYAGCRIAEQRAWIKALKQQVRREKIKLNTLIKLGKELEDYYNDDIPRKIKKHIYLEIKRYANNINKIKNIINEIEKEIKTSIKVREDIIKKNKDK